MNVFFLFFINQETSEEANLGSKQSKFVEKICRNKLFDQILNFILFIPEIGMA